jgi:5,10-methylenetetrahydromethanopterin reductase
MQFGITLMPRADSWRWVRRAEELGFTHVWFYDSPLITADPFQALALAAHHTESIRLCVGVLVPTNRIAPEAACCLASLNALAPGRVEYALGTGASGRYTMSLPPMRMAELRAYATTVAGLLRGETVELGIEGHCSPARIVEPDAGMNIVDPIPMHISAFGPKGQRLAAELASGWITFSASARLAGTQLRRLEEACAAVGRPSDELSKTVFCLGAVLEDGEPADGPRTPRARERAGGRGLRPAQRPARARPRGGRRRLGAGVRDRSIVGGRGMTNSASRLSRVNFASAIRRPRRRSVRLSTSAARTSAR